MEQLHRVQRYLDRMREIYSGCPHRYDRVEFYEDDVVSFFIHCHHIYDWLLVNKSAVLTKPELNQFINNHIELQVCADFCNGKKHCILTRTWSGLQPQIGKRNWMIMTFRKETGKPVTFRSTYEVIHGGVTYDALELAEKCLSLWQAQVRRIALITI